MSKNSIFYTPVGNDALAISERFWCEKGETPTLPFSVACFVIGSVVSTEYSYAEKFDVYDHGPINIYL